MKVSLVTVTPDMARDMLKKNVKNRPPNRKHIQFLTKEILEDRFVLNGDTICMSSDRLLDGQKRLMAVVEANKPIQTLLVEDVDNSVFPTKDIGQRRSQADTLSCEGESRTKDLAATLTYIERYFTGRVTERDSYSNLETLELLKKYPGARDSLTLCHHTKRLIPRSLLAACHYLFSQKHQEKADWFVATLVSGHGMAAGQPIYVLRERLMRNSLSKAKLSTAYMMALTIKAWNAELYGRKIVTLKFCESGDTPEAFPVVM